MIKKALLTSVCISSLFAVSMPLQAEQQHIGGMSSPSHCPPCPGGGGQMGWVLIPYGSMSPGGMPCEPGHGAGGERPGGMHEEPTWPTPHEPIRHEPVKPEPHVSEEDELEKNLRNVRADLHCRLNPHNGEKEKEWGKEWQGKVYFKELGRWVSHPVLPESSCASGQPERVEPTGNIQEPPKEEPKGVEQPKQIPGDTQEAINKSKPVLMKADGKNQWGRIYEGKKWIRGGNGQWVLLENEPSGQGSAQQGSIEERKEPEKEPVFFSSTNRSYTRGPGTYNPVVPGARGTPQEKLSPVNRPTPEVPVGE